MKVLGIFLLLIGGIISFEGLSARGGFNLAVLIIGQVTWLSGVLVLLTAKVIGAIGEDSQNKNIHKESKFNLLKKSNHDQEEQREFIHKNFKN